MIMLISINESDNFIALIQGETSRMPRPFLFLRGNTVIVMVIDDLQW